MSFFPFFSFLKKSLLTVLNSKRILSAFFMLFLILCLAFIYNNCSDISLSPMKATVAESSKFAGAFCSNPASTEMDQLNVFFVIDMSGSNIYNMYSTTPKVGTDNAGIRFDAVKSFINSDCVNVNSKVNFAVLGFSNDTLGAKCNRTDFKTATEALKDLEALKLIQKNEPHDPSANQTYMKQTYYFNAINCASIASIDHMASLGNQLPLNSYIIFFLTDGQPTDTNPLDVPSLKSKLTPPIDNYIKKTMETAGTRIIPISYGSKTLTEYNNKVMEDILTWMAEKGGSFYRSIENVQNIPFCEYLKSGSKTKYIVSEFGVINLTAKMSHGQLAADSDMDGLTDEEELKRGFDPSLPRSQYQEGSWSLDSLCPRGLSKKDCPKVSSCSDPNALGLTDCDVSSLNLTDGLDSDLDNIPDFIEILKGSSPNLDDYISDLDGDGIKNFEEILRFGRDPNFHDNNLPSQILLNYQHNLSKTSIGDCPPLQDSWEFNIENIPLVKTLKVGRGLDEKSLKLGWISHEENENVIMIFYIISAANEENIITHPRELWGQFVKINKNDGKLKYLYSPEKFQKIGVINGTFKAL